MMPPLDVHAHINVDIASSEVDALRSVIFAMTRSLAEAGEARKRHDRNAIWGVGCHPGLVTSLKNFDGKQFESLINTSALVGELGLDGATRTNLDLQKHVLREALEVLELHPRLVSLHSYNATDLLLGVLAATPIKGVILHWWLGSETATRDAVKAGYYFSFNASSVRKKELLDLIPISRILTETDHPYGDRWSSTPRLPGRVDDVEVALSRHFGLDVAATRRQLWRNFATLAFDVDCEPLLPEAIRSIINSLDEGPA
jgi:TatD DNase family protein